VVRVPTAHGEGLSADEAMAQPGIFDKVT